MIVGAFAVVQPPLAEVPPEDEGNGSAFASMGCGWRVAGSACGWRGAAGAGSAKAVRWTLTGVEAARALETGVLPVLIGS
jgi:hypothetical protein